MSDATKDLLEALKEVSQALAWQCFGTCRGFSERLLPPDEAISLATSAIARAEAALAEPQPDADGWIPWVGGECPPPVDPDALVKVKLRSGEEFIGNEALYADEWEWDHDGGATDIIAYRVVEERT